FAFWWALLTSPEVLVFLFFMLTDPKTSPRRPTARIAYAASVGLLAGLLIAPLRTEYATKVALLGALTIVCAARPLLALLPAGRLRIERTRRLAAAGAVALLVYAAVLVAAGVPARSTAEAAPRTITGALPPITILPSHGVETQLNIRLARVVAHDLLAELNRPTRDGDRLNMWLARGRGQ